MHANPSEKLVMMANQISRNLAVQGEERAIAEMSSHIRRYWEPRMRDTMKAYVEADGSALDPLAKRALQVIWPDLTPGKVANEDSDGILTLPTDSNQTNRPPATTPDAPKSALQPQGAVPKVATVKTPAAPAETSQAAKTSKKPAGKKIK